MEDSKKRKKVGYVVGIAAFLAIFVLLMYIEDIMPNETETRLRESGKVSGYSINVGSNHISVKSLEDVKTILEKAKAKYDTEGVFSVNINEKELSDKGQTDAFIIRNDGKSNMIKYVSMYGEGVGTGFYPQGIPSGVVGMGFDGSVIVKKTVISEADVMSDEDAVSLLTADRETNKVYIVEPGDCLGIVAQQQEMSLDRLLELNGFDNEGEILHVGDELIVSVPEPPLSVLVNEVSTKKEDYQADTTYIPKDEWYTTQTNTVFPGTTGSRIATNSSVLRNGRPAGNSLIAAVVIEESQPAVVEKGTQVPPTYIKPIRGGTFSSGFGPRWGTVHKGVDWACPTGTPVFASSAGVVDRAEFSSSYGYVVYINHPDGRQTRYAHNSKLACSPGDQVKQGEVIAYSGSTGNSTGPHVHFEILIGGAQVNPLSYLQ